MKHYIRGLNKFLYINGVNTRNLKISFSSIKFPGGTQLNNLGKSVKFIGIILYMVKGDEIFVVIVPYSTDRKNITKKRHYGEDDWTLFMRECIEETGITPDYNDAWTAHQHDSASDQDIPLTFLACKITETQVENLRSDFQTYNPEDPDKGVPMLVPMHYAWKFFSDSHLVGAQGFLQKILTKHLNQHVGNIREPFIKYCKGIMRKMEHEQQARIEEKQPPSEQS